MSWSFSESESESESDNWNLNSSDEEDDNVFLDKFPISSQTINKNKSEKNEDEKSIKTKTKTKTKKPMFTGIGTQFKAPPRQYSVIELFVKSLEKYDKKRKLRKRNYREIQFNNRNQKLSYKELCKRFNSGIDPETGKHVV